MSDQDSTIDLGGDSAAATIEWSGTDTITLSPSTYGIDLSRFSTNAMSTGTNTISMPSSSTYYSPGATVGGITTISNISNNSQWTTGTSGYQFNTTPNTVHISNTGIEMAAGTDIKVDGQSLKEFMKKMEQRLAILVPDPTKLEKFEALKKAYDHYKTMESLCFDEPEEEK
jgi:hypothetical protein